MGGYFHVTLINSLVSSLFFTLLPHLWSIWLLPLSLVFFTFKNLALCSDNKFKYQKHVHMCIIFHNSFNLRKLVLRIYSKIYVILTVLTLKCVLRWAPKYIVQVIVSSLKEGCGKKRKGDDKYEQPHASVRKKWRHEGNRWRSLFLEDEGHERLYHQPPHFVTCTSRFLQIHTPIHFN